MKIISPEFFPSSSSPVSSKTKLIISFIYIIYIYICVESVGSTLWCAIYITQLTNSYISSQFFLLVVVFFCGFVFLLLIS